MSGPVPTLGYPSKSQAAIALCAQGLSHRQIAEKIGVDPTAVGALLDSGLRRRRPVTRGGALEVRSILGSDIIKALQQAAEVRKTTVALVAARLLTHAARDGLITAILDDGGKP
jgi:hypothetical protein